MSKAKEPLEEKELKILLKLLKRLEIWEAEDVSELRAIGDVVGMIKAALRREQKQGETST